jgi:hypothetical protein
VSYLKAGLRIAAFDKATAVSTAKDARYFAPAVLFFSIGGVGLSAGFFIAFAAGQEEPLGAVAAVLVVLAFMVAGPLAHLAGSYVLARLSHAIAARRFGGRGEFIGYYSAMGSAAFLTWVPSLALISALFGNHVITGVMAALANIAEIWFVAVAVNVTASVYGITLRQAAASVLIPVIGALVPLVTLWLTI